MHTANTLIKDISEVKQLHGNLPIVIRYKDKFIPISSVHVETDKNKIEHIVIVSN